MQEEVTVSVCLLSRVLPDSCCWSQTVTKRECETQQHLTFPLDNPDSRRPGQHRYNRPLSVQPSKEAEKPQGYHQTLLCCRWGKGPQNKEPSGSEPGKSLCTSHTKEQTQLFHYGMDSHFCSMAPSSPANF